MSLPRNWLLISAIEIGKACIRELICDSLGADHFKVSEISKSYFGFIWFCCIISSRDNASDTKLRFPGLCLTSILNGDRYWELLWCRWYNRKREVVVVIDVCVAIWIVALCSVYITDGNFETSTLFRINDTTLLQHATSSLGSQQLFYSLPSSRDKNIIDFTGFWAGETLHEWYLIAPIPLFEASKSSKSLSWGLKRTRIAGFLNASCNASNDWFFSAVISRIFVVAAFLFLWFPMNFSVLSLDFSLAFRDFKNSAFCA